MTHRSESPGKPSLQVGVHAKPSEWAAALALDQNICDGARCQKTIARGEMCYAFVDAERNIRRVLCLDCAAKSIREAQHPPDLQDTGR